MNRPQFVAQYLEVVLLMNNIVQTVSKKDRDESGFRSVSPEFANLVFERTRLAMALADDEAGVQFCGWPK